MISKKKTKSKKIASFTKPVLQLSSIKESYRQNINYDDLIKILTSKTKWVYLEDFLKVMEKKEAVKKFGMCFIIKQQNNKKKNLIFQILYGDLEALETLDKKLFYQEKINCSLDDYQIKNASQILKKCRKPPNSKKNDDFYTFNTGNTIVLPNYKKFKINDIAHAFQFIKNVNKTKRSKFWNLVGYSLKSEIKNSKSQDIKICIHIGPCHQQGTPIFHIKIGKTVNKCMVGNHTKTITKKFCKNWSKSHDDDWLVDIIKPQTI